jgi:uncharacterized protein
VKWYTRAAEQGDSDAQYNLAIMYDEGEGVAQSDRDAIKWYTKAAEQENPLAQFNLAVCYATGQGVPKDYVQAYKWTLLAGINGEDITDIISWLQGHMTAAEIAAGQNLANAYRKRKQQESEKDEKR